MQTRCSHCQNNQVIATCFSATIDHRSAQWSVVCPDQFAFGVCLLVETLTGNVGRQETVTLCVLGQNLLFPSLGMSRRQLLDPIWGPNSGWEILVGGVIHLYTSDDRFTLCISCLNFPAFVALPCLPQCSWGQAETPGSNVYQRSLIPSEAPHRGVFVLLIWNCSFVLQWLLMYRDVHWIVSATVDTLWTNSPTDPLWLPHRRFYSAFELCIVHIPKAPILYSKNLYDLLDLLNIK